MIQKIEVARKVTGYHQLTDLSTATTCPGVGRVVTMQAEGGDIRYRPDGVDPTSEIGMLLANGESKTLLVNPVEIKLIQVTPGAKLNIIAYR